MCIEWKSCEYGKYLDYTLIGLLNSYIVLLINSNQYCFKHFVSFRQYGVTRVDKDEKVNILVVTNYDGSSIFNFTGLI